MKQVALFEFTVFQGIFPLASGYLEAAASADPTLRKTLAFRKVSMAVDSTGVHQAVANIDADIYAFSCYVWNSALVRRLIRAIRARRPEAYIVLGGPQVMHRAQLYLDDRDERSFVCNGEGERTFPGLLRQMICVRPNFHSVRGISFYDKGKLITNSPEDRIRDLNEIPSPYLSGVMDPRQSVWGVLETNRGCPFRCTYCYWGAATNAKVTKYELERILKEITWFGDKGILYLFIADANFGMLQRDLVIAQHIAATNKRTGYPKSVYFSSSKNTPDRVSEIAGLLADAGLVSTLPISLQTMSDTVLLNVKRENIRPESYVRLQSVLNEKQVSSFIEMIWPLPAETLDSFITGIGELCAMGADSFQCYPLLLIGNVEMEAQTAEYGLVSIEDPDPNSEARIVVETRDVTRAEYLEGVRLSFHVTSLHSLRGLWNVGRYLNTQGVSFSSLFRSFHDFCRLRPDHPYVKYIEEVIRSSSQYKFSALGGVVHNVLHSFRQDFDDLLADFVQSMGWLDNEQIRLRLDLDLLNRPFVYSNTRLADVRHLRILRCEQITIGTRLVDVPVSLKNDVCSILGLDSLSTPRLTVSYRSGQMPFMSGKSIEGNHSYCQDRLHMLRSILPTWSVHRFPPYAAPADSVAFTA